MKLRIVLIKIIFTLLFMKMESYLIYFEVHDYVKDMQCSPL